MSGCRGDGCLLAYPDPDPCDCAPAPLVAGAIGRSLSNAQAAYVQQLRALEPPDCSAAEQSPAM